MTLKLTRFDPERCGFPKPRVPLLPTRPSTPRRSAEGAARPAYGTARPEQAAGSFTHFTRGRYALAEAYRLAGVGANGALLTPAYHCVTMIDPAIHLGAEVLLYPLNADLSPDLARLAALVEPSATPVKALLATHYFGFAQDFAALKSWCDERGIALIEDCSHVLYTERFQAPGTGLYGSFVTSSPYKFFACEDGGLLHCRNPHPAAMQTQPAKLIDELRGIKHSIEKRWASDAMAGTTPLTSAESFARADEGVASYANPSSMFHAEECTTSSLKSSRLIVRLSSVGANIDRRRHHYDRWASAVADLPHCRALYPALPEACVPYMFPLYIDLPDPHFYALKHLGVPIWRWDQMAVSDCAFAANYRLHLLHLPCHQSLSDSEMAWMVAALRKTLCERPKA